MAKIMVDDQKRLNGASAEADFWYGDNLDHVEKKSPKYRVSLRPKLIEKCSFCPLQI